MDAAGTLRDDMRYFGVDAPRGARWYNFDPATYLESAMAGTFGGWEEGDPSGRVPVPGEVAVFGVDGSVTSPDPREEGSPIFEIDVVSWEAFEEFLEAGRAYE